MKTAELRRIIVLLKALHPVLFNELNSSELVEKLLHRIFAIIGEVHYQHMDKVFDLLALFSTNNCFTSLIFEKFVDWFVKFTSSEVDFKTMRAYFEKLEAIQSNASISSLSIQKLGSAVLAEFLKPNTSENFYHVKQLLVSLVLTKGEAAVVSFSLTREQFERVIVRLNEISSVCFLPTVFCL